MAELETSSSLAHLAKLEPGEIALLLFDIDGTITDPSGRIPAKVFGALEDARAAGLRTMPVTGRPAGWCDLIARTWPVDGVVGENGGLAFRVTDPHRPMERIFWQDRDDRRRSRERLRALAERILAEVPGTDTASDQHYRELDLAVDFCEDVDPLGEAEIARIEEIFAAEGAEHRVSNIHVNGWFGRWDKLSMCRRVCGDWFGLDVDGADRDRVVFVGDSANDEPMFEYFPMACGVANLRDFLGRLRHRPAFLADAAYADGFVEVCDRLLGAV